jgi:eukaryotic-like serine/threonine-protein kinase
MPLTAGARLGSYEIQSVIGAGGMGDVYRALDTKLGRPVALKTIPDSLRTTPSGLRVSSAKRERWRR